MRVLATGAGRSIGWATAEVLAERGHEVVATARDSTLPRDLNVEQILSLDVSCTDSVGAAVKAAGELDRAHRHFIDTAKRSMSGRRPPWRSGRIGP